MKRLKQTIKESKTTDGETWYTCEQRLLLNKEERTKINHVDRIRFADFDVVKERDSKNVYMIRGVGKSQQIALDNLWKHINELKRLLDREFSEMDVGKHFLANGQRGVLSVNFHKSKAAFSRETTERVLGVQVWEIAREALKEVMISVARSLQNSVDFIDKGDVTSFEQTMYLLFNVRFELDEIERIYKILFEHGGIPDEERTDLDETLRL